MEGNAPKPTTGKGAPTAIVAQNSPAMATKTQHETQLAAHDSLRSVPSSSFSNAESQRPHAPRERAAPPVPLWRRIWRLPWAAINIIALPLVTGVWDILRKGYQSFKMVETAPLCEADSECPSSLCSQRRRLLLF